MAVFGYYAVLNLVYIYIVDKLYCGTHMYTTVTVQLYIVQLYYILVRYSRTY